MVPIAEDRALLTGMLHHHLHPHFGLYAGPGASPAAAGVAEAVRPLGDARPAQRAQRPIVAVRARRAPSPS